MHRTRDGVVEVLLGHMGGPYWARKDEAAWSIPKGEIEAGEDPFVVACREFEEEMGTPIDVVAPGGQFVDLGQIRQRGGKTVQAWAVAGDFDTNTQTSNTFEIEWPPRSGQTATFAEIDRAGWFSVRTARDKLISGQRTLLDLLTALPS